MVGRSLLIFILLNCNSFLQAQKAELMFYTGVASYSMHDLKELNSDLQSQLPFNSKVTSDFPVTWQLGGQFAVQVSKKYKIGILYAYNSTGSRITSSDYSGSYYYDNIVTGHSIGMLNGFPVYDHNAFKIAFNANIGMVLSILKLKEELNVSDTTISTAVQYSALGIFLEPRFEFSYQWKHLKGAILAGYFVNPMGRIQNNLGEKSTSTISWSGFRFGFVLGISQ